MQETPAVRIRTHRWRREGGGVLKKVGGLAVLALKLTVASPAGRPSTPVSPVSPSRAGISATRTSLCGFDVGLSNAVLLCSLPGNVVPGKDKTQKEEENKGLFSKFRKSKKKSEQVLTWCGADGE